MKLFIIAGGQGTKLWPMSRENMPKQFQTIIGNKSLFRTCLEGLLKDFKPKDILVSTKYKYKALVQEQAPEIENRNIILEPNYRKNHGPATLYAMLKIKHLYPDEPCMLVQPDDLRIPQENFNAMIKDVENMLLENKDLFFTGGTKPPYPDMGSDYLKIGSQVNNHGDLEVYKVEKFIMRLGDYHKTKELISNYKVLTHNNHYACYPDRLLKATKEYRPDWHKAMVKIYNSFGKKKEEKITDKVYSEMDAGPIEEVTKKLLENDGIVGLLPFQWIDIGTWDSVFQYFADKPSDVYKDGNIISIDTTGTLIKGNKDKLIATLGVNNLIIVDTKDALLVCDKNRTNEIKRILKRI